MKQRKFTIAILIVYLAALLRITVFRSSFSFENLCARGSLNFAPFADLAHTYRSAGLLRFVYLFFGNIIWFMPFGAFIPMVFPKMRSVVRVIFASFLLSLFIESMQFVFGSGVSELDDLILNAAGGAAGYGLFTLWKKRRWGDADKM
jgi:glycopeptide antibiotics resistance protein